MGKYRKKPIIIEAFQWNGCVKPGKCVEIPEWAIRALDNHKIRIYPEFVIVNTLEGTMKALVGDWIIKGIQGELYPCKPDIFKQTYEPVE